MTAIDSCARKSGVPSRLGRLGGRFLLAIEVVEAKDFIVGGAILIGDVITSFPCVELNLVGDSSSLLLGDFLNFWEDLRGGGLGGIGDRRFFLLLSLLSGVFGSFFTVELEEEDVKDSLRAGSPCSSPPGKSFTLPLLPVRLLVTGGRVCAGLPC